jgi:hypothetical protein
VSSGGIWIMGAIVHQGLLQEIMDQLEQ